ncbi:efflux RND transporter periplasmic adaptor subunit [Alterisphingorhabdus coralli]|uniref:Efflux RND transporter periplasmic adaptor subunit n=1 Tax=Alterisphingorhabdus coralli TaxID=3071408 RepID=A0AA97HZM1_9SPHN|nr:efflux RND transporter periplasmic adaptor subunit [Parasphingorhabdus sp. SCSIO 66989]WOE74869.1 efflux RND transporter periplasmic adaptor subunit [Parasphingorhabdus sp. SCSIO 66989]
MKHETKISGERIETPVESPLHDVEQDELKGSSGRRNLIIAAIVAAAVIIGGIVYFSGTGAGETSVAAGADEGSSQAVTVVVPGSSTVERVINATGTFAARREMPIGVAGEGGQVIRVLVEPGTWVKQGQALAIIDKAVQNQQSRALAAEIGVAEADLQLAQNQLERAKQLVGRGFISQADVDQRTATRDQAIARLEVAKARLRERQAANARLNIVAPASGLVLERNVEPGQVVGAGSGVLFRMAAGGEMELRAQLSESDLAGLSNGVTAKVTPTGTSKSFEGQVWQVAPIISEQSRQGIARIALPYDPAIRPGGFGSVAIVSGATDSPVLPESAIQSDAKGAYVYIVSKDNKVERRDIETGGVNASGITVTSGLAGNEKVVLYAAGFLNPGETVNPQVRGNEQVASAGNGG